MKRGLATLAPQLFLVGLAVVSETLGVPTGFKLH